MKVERSILKNKNTRRLPNSVIQSRDGIGASRNLELKGSKNLRWMVDNGKFSI
jgi:hypothetical protein